MKLAFRTLFRTPFVTVVAILSLALGIGANAAIYSLFNQMLLRPLPVPQPERLVNSSRPGRSRARNSCNQAGDCDEVFSYPMFRDLEKAPNGVQRHRRPSPLRRQHRDARPDAINGDGHARLRQRTSRCSASSRRSAACSTPNDDQRIGGHYVAVLSYAYWETPARRRSRTSIEPADHRERPADDDRRRRAARASTGTTLGARPYVFVPITMRGVMNTGFDGLRRTAQSYWVYLFGRCKPGVTIEQARGGDQPALPRDHQRRRGAAAEGHERRRRWRSSGRSRSSLSRRRRGQS